MLKNISQIVLLTVAALVLASCVSTQKNKYRLVKDEATGYSYGATKSGEFIADPAMFRNSKMKLRIRNTTGDSSLDMYNFRRQLEDAYSGVGYQITTGDDFGILLDVNVKYFGQATEMLPSEYTFLGAAGGAVAGSTAGIQNGRAADTITGMAAGAVIGAALTEIIRNYATEETFIIISSITMATVMPEYTEDEQTISFVTGKKIRQKKTNFKGFRSRDTIDLAVYAGGRMADKSDIIDEVRRRHLRILKDVI
ncbi:complement resistance protein TraT [uncultured Pseudodesulfovibrio sp.]|uniref:complement resistance protein TraT n=1 Tax=uncultured Pseudodesulfovibrio sp. TaxID=2035858 RepID=UPI0029C728CB|nr:complement resistance protein TraT [uncultured Pseudodesulfovibrio sp.]